MFFLGFLLFAGIFVLVVFLLNKTFLPPGKARVIFPVAVFSAIAAYPFLHLIRPSYFKFKELCLQSHPPTILKTKEVDFILIDHGFSSDCSKGPEFIRNSGYLGFDCRKRVGSNARGEVVTELYRYTRNVGTDAACGLECFGMQRISEPEARFGFSVRSRTRGGYLAGDERRVTSDYPGSQEEEEIPFWRWLRFSDHILVDANDGDMAFTTQYYYLPYGPITILGLASGSAPSQRCPQPKQIDPRVVYKPRSR